MASPPGGPPPSRVAGPSPERSNSSGSTAPSTRDYGWPISTSPAVWSGKAPAGTTREAPPRSASSSTQPVAAAPCAFGMTWARAPTTEPTPLLASTSTGPTTTTAFDSPARPACRRPGRAVCTTASCGARRCRAHRPAVKRWRHHYCQDEHHQGPDHQAAAALQGPHCHVRGQAHAYVNSSHRPAPSPPTRLSGLADRVREAVRTVDGCQTLGQCSKLRTHALQLLGVDRRQSLEAAGSGCR